ncbi:aflatoxin regulatory protein-domain-containing protein [Aspergillus multicolor]|uniref:Zn(II)2Cys6 transcription factor n=1 Tax=Aspergillus multicolor TaxID=41759 RepID=UPI003CCD8021
MDPSAAPQQSTSTSTSTSASTSSTRKLRESCISCSRSKVRCNKEKPTCGRCVRRGLPCEYLVSRRTGRTRVIGVGQLQPPPPPPPPMTPTATPAAAAIRANAASPDHAPPGAATITITSTSPLANPLSAKSPVASSPEPDPWTVLLSPNTASSTDLTSLLSANTDFTQLLASLSPTDFPGPATLGHDITGTASELGDLSVTAPPSTTIVPGLDRLGSGSDAIETNPCCLSACLDLLMRLFPYAGADCERHGHDERTGKLCTIESVIEDNKQIVDKVQTILACTCAENEYVVTLISLIVFKVLGWYIAVARDRPSEPSAAPGHHLDQDHDMQSNWEGAGAHMQSQGNRGASMSSFAEEVLHLPTVVGSYCVDGHHQGRMAAQLVLSELHRVQRLVTLVGQRLEAMRSRSPSSSTSGSVAVSLPSSMSSSGSRLSRTPALGVPIAPLSSNTLANLEEDLRKRLRAVSTETIDILRRA